MGVSMASRRGQILRAAFCSMRVLPMRLATGLTQGLCFVIKVIVAFFDSLFLFWIIFVLLFSWKWWVRRSRVNRLDIWRWRCRRSVCWMSYATKFPHEDILGSVTNNASWSVLLESLHGFCICSSCRPPTKRASASFLPLALFCQIPVHWNCECQHFFPSCPPCCFVCIS